MNERFFGHDLRRPVAGTVPSAEESSRNGGACSAAPVGRDPASGGGEGFVADEVPLSGREIVLVLEPALRRLAEQFRPPTPREFVAERRLLRRRLKSELGKQAFTRQQRLGLVP